MIALSHVIFSYMRSKLFKGSLLLFSLLGIQINRVNNPHDCWFYACKSCCCQLAISANAPSVEGQKMTRGTNFQSMQQILSPATKVKVIANFVFFGNHGTALAGKEAALLAAQARGRPDFVPPAIASVVGKKCAVTAEAEQDTYGADPGHIILKVSRAELMKPFIVNGAVLKPPQPSGNQRNI